MNKQTIKNIITNRKMIIGEFEYAWQEFVIGRQEKIEEEIADSSSLMEIEELLNQINDIKLKNKIGNTIIASGNKATYTYYNRGLLDGLKLVLSLSEK